MDSEIKVPASESVSVTLPASGGANRKLFRIATIVCVVVVLLSAGVASLLYTQKNMCLPQINFGSHSVCLEELESKAGKESIQFSEDNGIHQEIVTVAQLVTGDLDLDAREDKIFLVHFSGQGYSDGTEKSFIIVARHSEEGANSYGTITTLILAGQPQGLNVFYHKATSTPGILVDYYVSSEAADNLSHVQAYYVLQGNALVEIPNALEGVVNPNAIPKDDYLSVYRQGKQLICYTSDYIIDTKINTFHLTPMGQNISDVLLNEFGYYRWKSEEKIGEWTPLAKMTQKNKEDLIEYIPKLLTTLGVICENADTSGRVIKYSPDIVFTEGVMSELPEVTVVVPEVVTESNIE